jgi:chromosome segregation ATPase
VVAALLQVKNNQLTKRLHMAEQALMGQDQQTQQAKQYKQQVQDLQQQLAKAQAAAAGGAAAAEKEALLQQCRQQLAAAEAEKAVLMDRIRQLADRASLAESQAHLSRTASGSTSSEHGSQQQQQVQSELSVACAELNQQVSALRGALRDAEAKEERLQVTNAQLQERISRLQVCRGHTKG